METIPYHFFSSDKLVCITSNKVASRFLGDVFPSNKQFDIELGKDFSYDDSMFQDVNPDITPELLEELKEDFVSIINNTSKKDILILYRNPFDRVLTGLIQNFYSDLFVSTHGASYDFKLKKILKEYSHGSTLYDKLSLGFNFPYQYDKFNTDEQLILSKLCIDYIFDAPTTTLLGTSHTNPYITYLYTMLKDDVLDTNKVHLIDISSSKSSLENFVKKYFEFDFEHADLNKGQTTNKVFTKIFTSQSNGLDFDDNDRDRIFRCTEKIKLLVSDENFFYEKMKLLPMNVK